MVVADIDPGNHASIRVAEKVRLRFAGIFDYGGAPAQRYSLTRAAFDQYMTG